MDRKKDAAELITSSVPQGLYQSDEERLHVITHVAGVLFVLTFGFDLWAAAGLSSGVQLGVGIYLFTFLVVFLSSSVYHLPYFGHHRHTLRKIDHIAIYFFIAGSNTPYLIGLGAASSGLVFLIVIWLLVIFGAVIKWMEIQIPEWASLLYYLFMGWLGVVTMYLIYDHLGSIPILLVVTGGILYSIGAYFYRYDRIKWYHSIWHIFVLVAAATHFLALYWHVALS